MKKITLRELLGIALLEYHVNTFSANRVCRIMDDAKIIHPIIHQLQNKYQEILPPLKKLHFQTAYSYPYSEELDRAISLLITSSILIRLHGSDEECWMEHHLSKGSSNYLTKRKGEIFQDDPSGIQHFEAFSKEMGALLLLKSFPEFLRLVLLKACFYLINDFEEKKLACLAKNGLSSEDTAPQICLTSLNEFYTIMYEFWSKYKNIFPVFQELHFYITESKSVYSRQLYDAIKSLDFTTEKRMGSKIRVWFKLPPHHEADLEIRAKTIEAFDGNVDRINAFCEMANQLAKRVLILEDVPIEIPCNI